MYGKSFESMYTGSLFGKTALVFAVWGYCITHQRPSKKENGNYFVELNPTLLASMFASSVKEVMKTIEFLESDDPDSRTELENGKRLIIQSRKHHGPMQFLVVNGKKYAQMRDEEERREQNRLAKQRERAADCHQVSAMSATVSHSQPLSDSESSASADSESSDTDPECDGGSAPHRPDYSRPVVLSTEHGNPDGTNKEAFSLSGDNRPATNIAATPTKKNGKASKKPDKVATAWDFYADAYERVYSVAPVRNARVNSQMAQFCKRIPEIDWERTISSYLASSYPFYVGNGHSVGCLLKDAEKLRTEAATGERISLSAARKKDERQAKVDKWRKLVAEAEEKEDKE